MKRIYLIALISALVAGIATYMFAQSVISNNDPNKDKTEIVYAISDVPAGTQVTANNVNNFFSTRMIDNGAIVDGAVRSLDEVIGNTSSGYIYAGEQVSIKRFGTEQESNVGLSYNLADGMVAYSMAADGVTGVDGYILPGDTVNVLAMKTGDGKATVDTVLSDVKVLKISTNDVNTDTANAIVTYSSITFELSYEDADILYGLDNIMNNSINGSGFNPKYGLLGSNKSTDEKLKLFPKDGEELVYNIQKRIKDETGKNVEVMIYGDGAFKDPVGKIWELADPVVSPFYTSGLEGTPNEIKLKYISDNVLSNLRGEELNNAMKDEIRKKEDNLVGQNKSLGTTPRRITDLVGSLCDLTSGSGDKGTPVVYIQGYFDNYANE